jgi:fructokinase
VVSTVGAGDSFSAAFLVNYLSGEKVSVCLNRACTLGSYVVTQLGAIPEYPEQLLAQIKPQ